MRIISYSSSPVLSHATQVTSQPPHFIQEPQDMVVYKDNLVLNCTAQGNPSPTITWYRGDPPALVPDVHVVIGSLVIPTVVEGVDASRGGIPYHCRATSAQFGTIRSRTANVYYACELHNYRMVHFLLILSVFSFRERRHHIQCKEHIQST